MQDIVYSHKAERDELLLEDYVPRERLEDARMTLDNDLIKVITGPRRAGKSVFAIQMLGKKTDFAYLNFDDERLMDVSDYDEILKAVVQVYGDTKYLFFDEIQNLDRWEVFVNRLQRKGYKIVVTGSNAHLLSQDLATHLTGRHLQFEVFPFSFAEFLKTADIKVDESVALMEKQGLILNHLNKYLQHGGYPEVLVRNIEPKSYLSTLCESILFKDVVKRYNVRYARRLSDMVNYLMTNHSCEFSYTKLKNILGFRSVHTVENYVSYLKNAFLIFDISRYSDKLKEQILSPRKAYAYDSGMINAVKFKTSHDMGRLIENLVAVELLRRGEELYYYKTASGKEVDFLIRKGLEVSRLIQVCYDIDEPATKKRELNSLAKVSKEVGCKNLQVLTWDFEAEERISDLTFFFRPLWKWLLER